MRRELPHSATGLKIGGRRFRPDNRAPSSGPEPKISGLRTEPVLEADRYA